MVRNVIFLQKLCFFGLFEILTTLGEIQHFKNDYFPNAQRWRQVLNILFQPNILDLWVEQFAIRKKWKKSKFHLDDPPQISTFLKWLILKCSKMETSSEYSVSAEYLKVVRTTVCDSKKWQKSKLPLDGPPYYSLYHEINPTRSLV